MAELFNKFPFSLMVSISANEYVLFGLFMTFLFLPLGIPLLIQSVSLFAEDRSNLDDVRLDQQYRKQRVSLSLVGGFFLFGIILSFSMPFYARWTLFLFTVLLISYASYQVIRFPRNNTDESR